jgi:hypothetical protein
MNKKTAHKKYVSVVNDNGLDYNQISEYMTKKGDKMNHSTARNLVVRSFIKIAENITTKCGMNLSHEQLLSIAIDRNFQEGVIDLIKEKENEALKMRKLNQIISEIKN